MNVSSDLIEQLKQKALWVRKETLKIHKIAPETRIASSLSAVEILVALYYGELIKFNPKNLKWENRDRFIISKGHGSICFFPILADLGFFDKKELERVGQEGSFLGCIPDCIIPGYETTNGALGHGLGVACGVSLGLKRKGKSEKVFVLLGDGELFEGAVWEAIMFAGEHKLNNLILIIDRNRVCMLDFCENVIDLNPLDHKFIHFRWKVETVDGHDIHQLFPALVTLKEDREEKPKVLIANTVKGKGVPHLETDPLSHVKNLKPEEIDRIVTELK
jgi:transketolase